MGWSYCVEYRDSEREFRMQNTFDLDIRLVMYICGQIYDMRNH